MLLQGFPIEYVLEGTMTDQITQVSDAVSPPVARALAEGIASALGYNKAALGLTSPVGWKLAAAGND